MANQVYANGREISCQAGEGKTICAFPDVCMTPPQTPATPPGVPIPYPNTGMASDCTDGSKNVKISGKEVLLKDKSYFKKSMGDEAGCAPMKGVVTHKNMGKVYFKSWSMDVKFEGENIVRHLDLTTHNHASETGQTPPLPHQDATAFGNPSECKADSEKANTACADSKPVQVGSRTHKICSEDCKQAMECILVAKGKDKEKCCSPDNTGDHLIEDHMTDGAPDFKNIPSLYSGAPCMCVNRSRYHGKHGIAHGTRGIREDQLIGKALTYGNAKQMALQSHKDANPDSNCSSGCIEAQLDSFYGKDPEKKCNTPHRKQPLKAEQRQAALDRISSTTSTGAGGGAP